MKIVKMILKEVKLAQKARKIAINVEKIMNKGMKKTNLKDISFKKVSQVNLNVIVDKTV